MVISTTVTHEQIFNGVLLLLLSLLCYVIYWYAYGRFQYFAKLGIPGPKTDLFIGNLRIVFKKYKTPFLQYDEWVKKYNGVFGMYMAGLPMYVISDVNLLKEIFTGKFDYFRDRMAYHDRPYPFNLMLGWSKGDVWKRIRTRLAPSFSPNKTKLMIGIFNKSADTCRSLFEEAVRSTGRIDIGEISRGFAVESILSAAFGLEGKSQSEINKRITAYGQLFFGGHGKLWAVLQWLPYSGHYMKYWPDDFLNSMKQMYKDVKVLVENRKQSSVKKHDLLQFMIDTQSKGTDGLTDIEINSQATNFMANGQDTISTTLTACLYELSKHRNYQNKVYEEVKTVWKDPSKPLAYEEAEEMVFLEQVIKETLRLHPAAPLLLRTCVKDIEIHGVKFRKNTYVAIPVYTLHRNPEAFEKPEEFYPEHFNDEAVKSRHEMYWLPFGYGPRICLGYKFAILEIKTAISSILQKYELQVVEETPKKLEYIQKFTLLPAGEIPVKVVPRN